MKARTAGALGLGRLEVQARTQPVGPQRPGTARAAPAGPRRYLCVLGDILYTRVRVCASRKRGPACFVLSLFFHFLVSVFGGCLLDCQRSEHEHCLARVRSCLLL